MDNWDRYRNGLRGDSLYPLHYLLFFPPPGTLDRVATRHILSLILLPALLVLRVKATALKKKTPGRNHYRRLPLIIQVTILPLFLVPPDLRSSDLYVAVPLLSPQRLLLEINAMYRNGCW